MGTDEAMESELGLGELAGLTVANEADSLAYDVSYFTLGKNLFTICFVMLGVPNYSNKVLYHSGKMSKI